MYMNFARVCVIQSLSRCFGNAILYPSKVTLIFKNTKPSTNYMPLILIHSRHFRSLQFQRISNEIEIKYRIRNINIISCIKNKNKIEY